MNNGITRFANGHETQRLARFLVVGGLSTVVDFTILLVLKSLNFPTILGNTLSYSVGLAVNFTLNRCWTYPDARSKRAALQFVQFVLISLCGLLLNNIMVLMMASGLNAVFYSNAYIPAKIAATLVVLTWNFSANRLWTFNVGRNELA